MEYVWEIIVAIIIAGVATLIGYLFGQHKEKNNRHIEINKETWQKNKKHLCPNHMHDLHNATVYMKFESQTLLPYFLEQYIQSSNHTDLIFIEKTLEKKRQKLISIIQEYCWYDIFAIRFCGNSSTSNMLCFYDKSDPQNQGEKVPQKIYDNMDKFEKIKHDLYQAYQDLDQTVKNL